ncbi:MAG TPA: OmpW family outer membrane protein [Cyclobacteriaceae bacterium]|jgi:hypothetical protein|nr:OmpW family outer membrane protein [Cyclobacteriaceae bacterium]
MKKIIYALALSLLVTSIGYAQDYHKFRVGLGIGYAGASGYGSSGGILATIEPSYRVQDNLSVGLRLESAAITRGYSVSSSTSYDISVAAVGSYTVNGQYYFKSDGFRPFAGVGLGMYTLAAVDYNSGTTTGSVEAGSKFGFYPRVGFDFRHFTMSADYNLIPSTSTTLPSNGDIKNSYLGIRIGVFFGGGKI